MAFTNHHMETHSIEVKIKETKKIILLQYWGNKTRVLLAKYKYFKLSIILAWFWHYNNKHNTKTLAYILLSKEKTWHEAFLFLEWFVKIIL